MKNAAAAVANLMDRKVSALECCAAKTGAIHPEDHKRTKMTGAKRSSVIKLLLSVSIKAFQIGID
jgi:hypothetical protein